jgi:insertion element IS1 protein InsB
VAFCSKKEQQLWIWLAVDRDLKDVMAFRVGSRGRKTLKRLMFMGNLSADVYATDNYRAYNILPEEQHVRSKAHTYTVEAKNAQIRHYLARFHRRTKCYSKAVHMVVASLILFFNKDLIKHSYN